MRKLNITDAFQLSKIIDKMEVRFNIDEIMNDVQNKIDRGQVEKAQSYLGGQMVLILVSKFHKAESEIIEWLSSLTEQPIEEIKKISLKELKELLSELFNSEGFMELFQ